MLRACHAKSHVIVQLLPMLIDKHAREQQVASGFGTEGIVPQGPKEAAYGEDHDEQPLQVMKQNCNAKGSAELQRGMD